MNITSSNKINKGLQKGKKARLISLAVLVILTTLLGGWGYFEQTKDRGEALDLAALMNEKKEKKNQYAYIDAASSAIVFAEKDNERLYFVGDKTGYLYIIDLTDTMVKKLENASKESPIKLIGSTKEITNDIRDLAISTYNKSKPADWNELNTVNFGDIFGNVYLYVREDLSYAIVLYVFAAILGFTTIIVGIVHLVTQKKITKAFKKLSPSELDKIAFEIEDAKTLNFENLGIYLTKNYFIVLTGGIKIFKYEDIAWLYHIDMRQNGVITARNFSLLTKDNKRHSFTAGTPYGKHKDNYLEILTYVAETHSNILVGYTDENKKHIKEIVKK